jgi:hypothetical protein
VTTTPPTDGATVHIIASLYNGAAYVSELLASVRRQTHDEWRLWLRDDGSDDATPEIARAAAAADARIVVLEGGTRLGPTAGFSWLLEQLPADAAYVMCADQDDVWLPHKVAHTLAAMRAAEMEGRGPVLVHTDLTVVDAQLQPIATSFWRFSGVWPEPVSLRRVVVENVATGATVMLNRPLRELASPVPAAAVYHDWWFACVAAAFGRIVALHEPTILYRQHGANVVGALRRQRTPIGQIVSAARAALGRTAHLRGEIARTARQAAALLERFEARLTEDDRRFLRAYARLPGRGLLRRKLDVARLRLRREHGVWRNLGVLLRA